MWTRRSGSPTYTRKIQTLVMQLSPKKKMGKRLSRFKVIYLRVFQAKSISITKLCKKWETSRKRTLDKSLSCYRASLRAVLELNQICSAFHLQSASLSSSNLPVLLSNKSATQSQIKLCWIKILDDQDQGTKAQSNFDSRLRTKCIINPSNKICSTTKTQPNNTPCIRQRTWTHLLNTSSRTTMAPLLLLITEITILTVVFRQSGLESSKLWSVEESNLAKARASTQCQSRNNHRRTRTTRRKMMIKFNFDSNFSKDRFTLLFFQFLYQGKLCSMS